MPDENPIHAPETDQEVALEDAIKGLDADRRGGRF